MKPKCTSIYRGTPYAQDIGTYRTVQHDFTNATTLTAVLVSFILDYIPFKTAFFVMEMICADFSTFLVFIKRQPFI